MEDKSDVYCALCGGLPLEPYWDDDELSYDESVLKEGDVAWMGDIRVIGEKSLYLGQPSTWNAERSKSHRLMIQILPLKISSGKTMIGMGGRGFADMIGSTVRFLLFHSISHAMTLCFAKSSRSYPAHPLPPT
ncbi:hypothetical protein VTN77DRAFT_7367 [Rasamsonia byssochlamydoides]|uniref:uncharacterized protein n=1 Tax=Rasamsonia byssochlamydoides TaxID=89139 RepID=UPI003744434D